MPFLCFGAARMSNPEVIIASLGCLTPREAEAVLWVAQGKTSWEAGCILGVAASTLDAHVTHAAEKLGAVNRAHLITKAFVRGILAAASCNAMALLLALVCAFGPPNEARRPPRRPRIRRRDEIVMIDSRTPAGSV